MYSDLPCRQECSNSPPVAGVLSVLEPMQPSRGELPGKRLKGLSPVASSIPSHDVTPEVPLDSKVDNVIEPAGSPAIEGQNDHWTEHSPDSRGTHEHLHHTGTFQPTLREIPSNGSNKLGLKRTSLSQHTTDAT